MPIVFGAILISTVAASSVGGNYAGPGGVVHQGDSQATVSVTTITGNGGTTTIISGNPVATGNDDRSGRDRTFTRSSDNPVR